MERMTEVSRAYAAAVEAEDAALVMSTQNTLMHLYEQYMAAIVERYRTRPTDLFTVTRPGASQHYRSRDLQLESDTPRVTIIRERGAEFVLAHQVCHPDELAITDFESTFSWQVNIMHTYEDQIESPEDLSDMIAGAYAAPVVFYREYMVSSSTRGTTAAVTYPQKSIIEEPLTELQNYEMLLHAIHPVTGWYGKFTTNIGQLYMFYLVYGNKTGRPADYVSDITFPGEGEATSVHYNFYVGFDPANVVTSDLFEIARNFEREYGVPGTLEEAYERYRWITMSVEEGLLSSVDIACEVYHTLYRKMAPGGANVVAGELQHMLTGIQRTMQSNRS